MLFAMARDGRLPFGSAVARVSGRGRVPIVPALLTGALAICLLLINLGNQSAFTALTSLAIILFYIAYLGVTLPMLIRRFRGTWPRQEHGPYFSLGRWGLPVNLIAVVYGILVAFNISWPRKDVYNAIGAPHWYFQYAAWLFIALAVIVGTAYYFLVYHRKPLAVLAEHRAEAAAEEAKLEKLGTVTP
jgi:amino acid transporter